MISIVRMQVQEKDRKERVWNHIVEEKEELQKTIEGGGRLLYLSERSNHEDLSLFLHLASPDVLADFIVNDLTKIQDITGIWVINLLKPMFFPLPKDTRNVKRYMLTVRVFPKKLGEVYENLAKMSLPKGLTMSYLAFTFRLFGHCIQFSLLAEEEETLRTYLSDVVDKMPGVLRTTVNVIERTKPLLSYEQWKQYAIKHWIVPSWDEEHMIGQFQWNHFSNAISP